MTVPQTLISVMIADDELLARKRLTRLLAEIPQVELAAVCQNGQEVLQTLRSETVDIALLDIQMPGLSGIDIGRCLADTGPQVIFVTAHPEHALDAFDVGAVDYVVKPVALERLKTAIERAAARISDKNTSPRLAIETSKGVEILLHRDICHVSYDGFLTNIHTNSDSIATTMSLSAIEKELAGNNFVRVHRRHILNMDSVHRLESVESGGYIAHTQNGDTVPISRQAARELRKEKKFAGSFNAH